MDPIKEAFLKVKQDMLDLQTQTYSIKSDLLEIKDSLSAIYDQLSLLNQQSDRPTDTPTHVPTGFQTQNPTHEAQNPSFQHINQTNQPVINTNLTSKMPLEGLKSLFKEVSTGNEGVPTDRQTNQPTDNPMISYGNKDISANYGAFSQEKSQNSLPQKDISEVLDSLDALKQDIRKKFKQLTPQEMTVFATLYQLEEEGFIVDYSLISAKLRLSESSIRDYVQKIIKKGIQIVKTKENNKRIFLSVQQDLKKIASLATILALREL